MLIIASPDGSLLTLYDESIDLGSFGRLSITRASHVEPDDSGRWWVDLAPVDGPRFGPFDRRSDALQAELLWLEASCFTSNG